MRIKSMNRAVTTVTRTAPKRMKFQKLKRGGSRVT